MNEEIGNFTRVVKTVKKEKIHLQFKNTVSEFIKSIVWMNSKLNNAE